MNWIYCVLGFVGFCLVWPWVVCYLDREDTFIHRYLDWVYDIVNRKEG